MASSTRIIFVVLVLFSIYSSSLAVPLSTKSRWVIDDSTGKRVKLACANWVGHLETLLPEGLSKQPLSDIVRHIGLMGLNCIRLTYAAHMFTRYSHLTVVENFEKLGLHESLTGIAQHNPNLLSRTVVEAQKAVIKELSSQGIMVILDNQVSQPMWCCGDNDGNGFFGDKYFNPEEWLDSLTTVAKLYRHTPMVMGMSLRNEIRGPRQNETVWYHYIEKGATAVHQANPNLLVIVSGLSYAIRLEFLKERPLKLNFKHKLMYETHRYAFSAGNADQWKKQPQLNDFCQSITQQVDDKSGFVSRGKHAAPMFLSEFGLIQYENNTADNNFFACFLNYLAENDFEWALWTLQGDYYLRQGNKQVDELYGIFSFDWDRIRGPDANSKLQLIRQVLQDPFSKSPPYYLMFHPLSGKCLRVDNGEIHLSECFGMARWSHHGHGKSSPIKLLGSGLCLTAVGDGLPVALTQDCNSRKSMWKHFNKYQLVNVGEHGDHQCLEWDPSYTLKLVTKQCIFSREGHVSPENPQKQWFSLIKSNVE